MIRRALCIIAALLLLLTQPASAEAGTAAPDLTEIHTAEELQAIGDNPEGSYILMADLDMAGFEWKCIDFAGRLDGNGHSILNLTLSDTAEQTAATYDGNKKKYDTTLAGMFGTLSSASISNLNFVNLRGRIVADTPCFFGGIAGYSENSEITGCTLTGCLELRAFDRIFGLGGMIGYGTGTVSKCTADVTLICTDTDSKSRDEQYMGGIFAAGFMDVLDSAVTIAGFCSEYGYAHNGGITGMYLQKPLAPDHVGRLTGNTVKGKITFFEDNTDRRAYCRAEAGEVLADRCIVKDNRKNFWRDEHIYSNRELRPEMCAQPEYSQKIIPAGCNTFGYTLYRCGGCGYEYTDHYTLHSHTVTQWSVQLPPTTHREGLSSAACDLCGMTFERTETKLPLPDMEPLPAQPVSTLRNGIPAAAKITVVLSAACIIPAALFFVRRIKELREE